MNKTKHPSISLGTVVTVKFSALTHGGSCVGTVIDEASPFQGLKVFVVGAIPTETATVQITSTQGNFCEGEIVKLIERANARQTPACPLFNTTMFGCGGCDFQHIETETQRELKRQIVEQTLKYQAKLIPENGVYLIGDNLPHYNYRRRITLHINELNQIGFYQKKSGNVIECQKCLLIANELNQIIPSIKTFIKEHPDLFAGIVLEFHNPDYFMVLKLTATAKSSNNWQEILAPLTKQFKAIHISQDNKIIYQYTQNQNETFPFGHFCQVNAEGNQVLVKHVLQKLQGQNITEFYAGAGNFSFPLVRAYKNVTAIELDPALVEYADFLKQSDLKTYNNLKFVCSSTENYLKHNQLSETILLDPPRSGALALANYLSPQKQKEIVYVSCNPATLTRDLKILVSKGYKLKEVAVLDMFSQTQHVETVALISRS